MKKSAALAFATFFAANVAFAQGITVGQKLPPVVVEKKGQMVIEYDVVNDVMTYKDGTDIQYETFNSSALNGKIRTIYHLAARTGIDDINNPYIDALIAAQLPEKQPDSAYKTVTILNTDDALWGTAGIASGQLEDSQKETAYAYYVVDEKGVALQTWQLKKKGSAVIVLDRDGTVLYFKDGKLSDNDIASAVAIIKEKLAM